MRSRANAKACRSRAWQKKREREVSAALGEIEAAAEKIQRVVGRDGE